MPSHGVASNIATRCLSDAELEDWPTKSDWRERGLSDRSFLWDRYERWFDQPFSYGRLGNMVLILIFDSPRWLQFFCSPTKGGEGSGEGVSSRQVITNWRT